jgi:hypothetical protein
MPSAGNLPRRTIQELAAVHRFASGLHDVIVEGTSDRAVIEWFLDENKKRNFAVLEVDNYQVDPADILALGLRDNNRGRVIALAHSLAELFDQDIGVTCVADLDFDFALGANLPRGPLLLTDYSCMIMYTFNERVLNKYLRIKFRALHKSAARVIQDITGALLRIFAFRLAKQLLLPDLIHVDWRGSCALGARGVEFDMDAYIVRCLNRNARRADEVPLRARVAECRALVGADPRLFIRGHDYVDMLIWYVSQHTGFRAFARRTPQDVELDLFSCLEIRDLDGERLFQSLLGRVAT